MKLKYYLRGLGIGIVVTALLMGYSNKNRAAEPKVEVATEEAAGDLLADRSGEATTEVITEENTAEQIAETVFLTEETETSSIETSEEQTVSEMESASEETETVTETESTAETETESSKKTEETGSIASEAADRKEQSQSSAEPESESGLAKSTIEINIVKGDDSGTVARKLQNAGMVESATEYDAYLMQHGYDKKIRVGKVEIPVDATWQEIAEYISGRR